MDSGPASSVRELGPLQVTDATQLSSPFLTFYLIFQAAQTNEIQIHDADIVSIDTDGRRILMKVRKIEI
jgi:hypothetical protein